jgi:hypothetical protein
MLRLIKQVSERWCEKRSRDAVRSSTRCTRVAHACSVISHAPALHEYYAVAALAAAHLPLSVVAQLRVKLRGSTPGTVFSTTSFYYTVTAANG